MTRKEYNTQFKLTEIALFAICSRIEERKSIALSHTLTRSLFFADIGDMESAVSRIKFVQRWIVEHNENQLETRLN